MPNWVQHGPSASTARKGSGALADDNHTNHQLIELLNDQEKPADDRLPNRGVPIEKNAISIVFHQ